MQGVMRFSGWGMDPRDQKVLIALELLKDKMQLAVYLFPKADHDKEFLNQVETVWVKGEDLKFPEQVTQHLLPMTEDSVLPEEIRADNPIEFRTVQNDWAYAIFVERFWKAYLDELTAIKEEARQAERYTKELFEKTKDFWDRVLEQKKEQNIGQEKIDEIKSDVDLIFEKLKALRQAAAEDRKKRDQKAVDTIKPRLEKAHEAIEAGEAPPKVITELKEIRSTLNGSGLRGKPREELSALIDAAFEKLKAKKAKVHDSKLQKRINDLQGIVTKLERSIDRDKKELNFQDKRLNSNASSDFELKLRATKREMVEEQLKSKEAKLKDIRKTLESLQSKGKD